MQYFDTSVIVPFYCAEPLSVAAEYVLLKSAAPNLSKLTEVEFVSALSLKTRTGQLDVPTAKKIEVQFRSHLTLKYFGLFPLGAREFDCARDWIARFSTPLRTLDALHLAIAHFNKCELITADRALEKSATLLGVKCSLVS